MFSKILNIKQNKYTKLIRKVQGMNLVDMRTYINNKMADCPVSEYGLNEIMKTLISTNEKTSKRFIETDDMDSKIKKSFELVLLIGKNKKITTTTLGYVLDFIKVYADILKQYDTKNKEIYSSRFIDMVNNSIVHLDRTILMQQKDNYNII